MTLITPLPNAFLSILAMSLLPPLVAPAPFIMCASSINNIHLPFFSSAPSTFLRRSSKSPRYLLPANNALISKLYTSCSLINSGTLPSTILRASPSAIAVLPTPGSPIIITLDLILRANTNCISSISFSRPITGSIFLPLALVVRLVQNCTNIFSI